MLVAWSFFISLVAAAATPGPTVQLPQGKVVGGKDGDQTEFFLGVPFAEPPVGNLRLARPVPRTTPFGTLDATQTPNTCPQFLETVALDQLPLSVIGILADSPFYQNFSKQSEDCLTINVYRPAGVSKGAKLPVLFWLYGGAFETGSASATKGTNFVTKSLEMKEPVIYVAPNYRLGGFGFLHGKEMQKRGLTNLGLRDQRLALEWVQDNIEAFGGDPKKVTIWGQSAGSVSVFDQLIINRGDNTYKGNPLFRGAMMSSGTAVPAQPVDHAKPQGVYDIVVKSAGCADAPDQIACLRSLDYISYLNAANSVTAAASYRALDIAYIPRPDPTDNFYPAAADTVTNSKEYAKVPIIVGDMEDEGTFACIPQLNLITSDNTIDYLHSYFPDTTRDQVAKLVSYYPDSLPEGSPYHTGYLWAIYPQFKHMSAIVGDFSFILTRRIYLSTAADIVPSWSYLGTFLQGLPVLGTYHAADTMAIYGGQKTFVRDAFLSYFISFVNHLDPNVSKGSDLINWPKWTNKNRTLLNVGGNKLSLLPDDFRQAPATYLAGVAASFRI